MANEEFVEKLLKERYCIHNDSRDERVGNVWDNISSRVAEYLANDDDEYDSFKRMIYQKNFLPNSPTLMNAGTDNPMLSACFYLPISDCISNGYDGIFDQVKNAALIFKFGGGVGLNFSNLRPAGSAVRSTHGVSSGVISFMKNFNTMTETIKQGGKRRGALMGCLDVDHKEIESFITCKNTEGELSNFNISVKITDDFMHKIENNDSEATRLFSLMVDGIYKNGEPGLLFKDEIERHNPNPELGGLNPNPCAEALLNKFESCNLGSINWSSLYEDSDVNTWQSHINWKKYENIIRNGVILLNRVIDTNKFPLDEIDKASKLTRKIGLGGMGFHDLLLKLKIPYDSPEALNIAYELESMLKSIAKNESEKHKFNNTSLTTIAPTGTISIIADVSSGIEPVFNWVITRKDSVGEHFIVHPIFEQELIKEIEHLDKNTATMIDDVGYVYGSRNLLLEDTIKHCHTKGTIQDINWLSPQFKELFKNAMDINWVQHIKMQAMFQTSGVDMSISKTINLPNSATKEDIKNAIFMAWKMHCKGITIYRSGSRENEVLNLNKDISDNKITLKETIDTDKRKDELPSLKRPRHLYGVTYKIQSGCGKLYVTINERNGKPYEVFIQSGGSGGCEAGNQALGRTISFALRTGGNVRDIIKQLSKVKCPAALRNIKSEGKSCSDIVAKLLRESLPDVDEDDDSISEPIHQDELLKKMYSNGKKEIIMEECPECHEKTLIRESGCKVCNSCGYNKCG